MVRSYINVIIPLVLAFAIGVLVYLYGTSNSQFHEVEQELKEIKKDLADARSEKESLRYELDTLTDELEQLSKDKKEALQRAEAAEENAHKAQNDMVGTYSILFPDPSTRPSKNGTVPPPPLAQRECCSYN